MDQEAELRHLAYQKSWNPLHIVDAEGCYFTDANGKRYLDFSAQLMCCNLGHKNQAVIQAIEEQARKLAYIMPATRPIRGWS
jgi:taurine--2-oxoglutarate transaminase